jgi:hypothetical protein
MQNMISGQIISLYEWYLNTYEFDKMTDENLEKIDKVCDVFLEAAMMFAEEVICICDDLRKFIINRRKEIGIPMSEAEIMVLTNATEQTDAYIQDISEENLR